MIRVRQWYKNLVVFLSIFFVGNLFDCDKVFLVLLGFVSLCLVSSSNYIINDIIDFKKDKLNPEKRKRPIASGKIKRSSAFIFALILFLLALIVAIDLGKMFLYCVIFLFIFTQIYSFFLKHEIFLDTLAISINFLIRAAAGAFIIGAPLSPGYIGGVFFLALFLAISKRAAEIDLLEEEGHRHRRTLKYYSSKVLHPLTNITATSLIISYAFFSLQSINQNLVYTTPIFIYTIFRYIHLVYTGSIIPRHPELIYKDKPIMMSMFLLLIIAALLIYYESIYQFIF